MLDRLRSEDEEFLVDLQERFEGGLSFKPDRSKHMEFFSINDPASGRVLFSSRDR